MNPQLIACSSVWRWQRTVIARTAQFALAIGLGLFAIVSTASAAQTLRVVTYNIAEDIGGSTGTPGSDLTTVLQGIGSVHLANNNAQPIDVLALQELYQTPTMNLSAICIQLNAIYPSANYVYDTTLDHTTDPTLTGNGPSGLIYNQNTVKFWSAAQIGNPSTSGAPRAPMRYTLAPKGYTDHSADFTIYVSHMKSGTAGSGAGSNGDRRNIEAQALRDDAFALNDALNGTTSAEVAHVIYVGDFNVTGSTEAAYQTMISTSVHSGIMKGNDVLNPANNWSTSGTTSSPFQGLFTEASDFVQFRDDFQFVTNTMIATNNKPGMQLVPNSMLVFGNGGNIFHQSVTSSSNSNALTDLSNRSAVLSALVTASDHLPVVADYSFATAVGAPGDYDHSGVVNTADYNLWRSTFGTTGANLLADGNHNNVVDAADYVIWRKNAASGSGAEILDSGNQVPEPAAWLLMLCGCLATFRRGRLRG